MIVTQESSNGEIAFVELRRKVRCSEVLSAAFERLLRELHFTGRVSVVVQNGQILKSGYEEGYFRNRPDKVL
jgi:sulfur carrier protein ThiS